MNSFFASARSAGPIGSIPRLRAGLRGAAALALAGALAIACAGTAQAATALADQPLFATPNVPGNLALVLSVEYPTAVSVAHVNRTYSAANEYLGYFDPNKCYSYKYSGDASINTYFEPAGKATAHACSNKWSGNFLNWAAMQTIDPFRWALSGGYRVIDTDSVTVVEKAWASGQGNTTNFPDASTCGAAIPGATPFGSTQLMGMRIQGLGNKMRFTTPAANSSVAFAGEYFNNQTLSGSPVLTRTDCALNFNWGTVSPDPVVNQSNMSARWTASVPAKAAGGYQFRIKADDTVKLWVNGTLVVDERNFNVEHVVGPYTVAANQAFDIKVEFSQGSGGSGILFEWNRPGDAANVWTVVGSDMPSMNGTATHYAGTLVAGTVYEVFVRAKVCVDASQKEENCTLYPHGNYKPEGLLQKYANKIRYSALGYLDDDNIARDGGVLRARQKFVGPTQPVPGSTAVDNLDATQGGPAGQVTSREWSAVDGTFFDNPDKADADASAALFGPTPNSGVLNYLNKFGGSYHTYKTYDNVSELYYAAIRYFKAMPDVPEWTAAGSADAYTKGVWADTFPVIKSPADPILYSCQRNFILGIGDVNTHADKDVPGRLSTQTNNEPSVFPSSVQGDTSVNAVARTDQIGAMEGLGNIGSQATYGGDANSAAIAGLAYDAHVKDIRPDVSNRPNTIGKQTIDTYWVDVQEGQAYANNNQFYLATKYGGFTVPTGYDPDNTTALTESWWHTNTDTFGTNKRPDNYYSGGRPDLMKAGLDAAFSKIAASITAYTTSFSTSLPQLAVSGNSSFASKYDATTWSGEITASNLSFNATTNAPTLIKKWDFTEVLAAQLAGNGWSTKRRVFTWNGSTGVAFRAAATGQATSITGAQLGTLDTDYVTGNDAALYLNYLRGDQTNEVGSTATGSTRTYRARAKLLGDIVGSKALPVGTPSFPFSDATNPGYAAFKTQWTTTTPRRTVVYVGSNDGMLHAINGALETTASATLESDVNAGKEMFAYVPSALFDGPSADRSVDGLAALGNPKFTHHYMVNATPSVADVDFARVPNATGARQSPVSTVSDWHSVLIGGLGKGGRSYYALDVTDPVSIATAGTEDSAAGKVLWEFSNSTTGMAGELGFSYGEPMVMKTQKYGWVVVFLSGYNNADGKGYFFFVNPKTGALLEPPVPTNAGSVSNDAGLAHANAFIVDATDGTADAIYAGDLLGNLWRLDVTGTGSYSAAGRLTPLAKLTDVSTAQNPQPVTSRPSIEVHPGTKKRFVMVGTGRLLDTTDVASTQRQTFYAIADGYNASFNTTPIPPGATPAYPITRSQLIQNSDALVGATFNPATQVGWYEELGIDLGSPAVPAVPASGSDPGTPAIPATPSTNIAWRITSDSTTLSGSVAFAATLPNGNVCTPSGDSRVYARDYAAASTTEKVLVNNVLVPTLYVSIPGTVTDLRYLSVGGKAVLLSGADTGKLQPIDIKPIDSLSLRRLNWRELQVVD